MVAGGRGGEEIVGVHRQEGEGLARAGVGVVAGARMPGVRRGGGEVLRPMTGTEEGDCHLLIIEEVVAEEIEAFGGVGAGAGARIAG